ncbi:hypothetical protein ABE021_09560 [Sporosarcina gallistercoris]|uniref:hypothetical protein n=1 Tax=Sporosarcina gallistercoris TaxID=2762245 RepID=UPI003D2E715A
MRFDGESALDQHGWNVRDHRRRNVRHKEVVVDHAEGILHHLEKILRHIGKFLDNGTQFTWRKELISSATLVCVGYLAVSGGIGMNGPFVIIGG